MNDRFLLKTFIHIKKSFPSSTIFYYIYFSFKLLGFILATQNLKGYESKDNNITSVYSIFSKFLLFDSSFSIISNYYEYICIIIFLFLIFIFIFLVFVFFRMKNNYLNIEKRKDYHLIKFFGKNSNIKKEIKRITYLIIIISLFSQFIEEYLLFGIMINFINKSNEDINSSDSYLSNFLTNNYKTNKLFIMLLNIISFFILFSFDSIIILFNDTKGFVNQYGIDIYSNQPIKICYIFLTFCQSLIGYSYIFDKKTREIIRYIICCYAIILSLIYLILSYKRFNYYFDSPIPKFILLIVCFSFCGGIFEIIMHFFIKKKQDLKQNYSIIKFILNISSSIFMFSLIQNINNDFFTKNLISNLFKLEEKKRYIGEIYLFIKLYCMYRKDNSNFELFKILYTHRKLCKTKDCFCQLIKKKLNMKKITNNLKKDEYIIIGEQEIVNRINYLYKNKKFSQEIEHYIILHCQYIYAIKNCEYYALYLCSMYLNTKFKMCFQTKYFLCELKKEIIGKIKSKKDIRKGNLIIGNLKNINNNIHVKREFMRNILQFILFIENIKTLIDINFKYLEKVLSFKKLIIKSSKLGKMNQKTFGSFLSQCSKVREYDNKIKKTILNYYKKRNKENQIIKSNEISYILTNYFILLHKKIPYSIENKFIKNFDLTSIESLLNYNFSEFQMEYPIILSQNPNDIFNISYMNDVLSNELGFTQEEIKNRDFNELIPFDLRKEHHLILKQFSCIQNAIFKTPYSYILTKGNNLINISFHTRGFPTLHFLMDLITNIRIIENEKKSSLSYHIFLDKNGYFMNTCKEFENNFFFDIKQLKLLNITFNNFFGINTLEKKNTKEEQINLLYEETKAISIFSTIPNEKMFYLRKKKKSSLQLQHKKYHFTGEIYKKNVQNGIQNLNHILDEKGLDIEWYNRVNCLVQRFQISEENSARIYKKKKTQKTISFKNLPEEEKNLFYLDYHLKSLGNIKYYIIKMTENTDIKLLKNSTFNLKKLITTSKKITMLQNNNNTVLVQNTNTKRSDFSPVNSLYSANTNTNLIQTAITSNTINNYNNESSIIDNNNFNNNNNIINSNIRNSNVRINLNNANNNNITLNGSLMNNSKSPFIDDSKNITSGLSLIQNIANNEIERINQINNSNNSKKNTHKKVIKFNLSKSNIKYKKNKFLEKFLEYYSLFVFLSFGSVIILSIILLILKNKKIYTHKDLFQFNVYIEILKFDIYLSGLNTFTLCYQSYFNDWDIQPKTFISPKITSFQDNIANFNKYLDKIKGNNKLKILYSLLYKKNSINEISIDWKISLRFSSIIEEMTYLLYKMYQIYFNDDNSCQFWVFMDDIFIQMSIQDEPPSDLEKFIFYGMSNILNIFKFSFENITFTSSEILLNYYQSYFQFVSNYGISIIFLTFICYFVVIQKLTDDKNEIKKLLIHLFNVDDNNYNQIIFENQVYCFQIMCKNFTEKNILKFESSKYDEPEFLTKKINKKNKQKDKKTNHSNTKIKEKITQTKEENIDNKTEMNKKIYLPKSVTLSYIIITFCLLMISIVMSINIIYAYLNKKKLIFIVKIAMCFLERIPKSFEVTYFVLISLITVNVKYLNTSQLWEDYLKTNEYLNYYNVPYYYFNNSLLLSMNETFYPNIFLPTIMVENNIKLFLGKKTSILNNIKYYENEFNKKNNFCYSAAIASLERILDIITNPMEYFKLANQKVNFCYTYNYKTIEYGLLVELNFIYQEMTNIFYDFIKSEYKYALASVYITIDNVRRIILDYAFIFEYVFRTYSHFILKDINHLYLSCIRIENILSAFLIITLLFVVIYVVLLIGKGNKNYKKLLMFFYKMY